MVTQIDRSKLVRVANPDRIVYFVNTEACAKFGQRYPLALELAEKQYKGTTFRKRYCKFLDAKESKEGLLGASMRLVSSPTFGSKAFEDYEWMGVSGWAEFFTYAQKAIL